MSATVAAGRGLRAQRRHVMVSSDSVLRSAHRGPAAVAGLDRWTRPSKVREAVLLPFCF